MINPLLNGKKEEKNVAFLIEKRKLLRTPCPYVFLHILKDEEFGVFAECRVWRSWLSNV